MIAAIFCMPALAYSETQVLGQAESVMTAVSEPNARCAETTLGNLAADAIRDISGTDLAVVPGGAFAANLDAGEITWLGLCEIFPTEDDIVTMQITPAELYAMLEQSVGCVTLSENEYIDYATSEYDGFLQVSGFRFRYDVSSLVGERVSEVTLSDGRTLERTADAPALTIAFPQSLLDEYNDLRPAVLTDTELSIAAIMAEYVQNKETVPVPESGRIDVFGSNDNAIICQFSIGALLIAVVLFAFSGLYKPLRSSERFSPKRSSFHND